jgi:F0F1-type ATP synthase gamma subunit
MKKRTVALRNYVDHLLQTLMIIQEQINLFSTPVNRDDDELIEIVLPELHIVVGSEKGLCGSLNAVLHKEVHQQLAPHKSDIHIFAVGNKTFQFFSKQ